MNTVSKELFFQILFKLLVLFAIAKEGYDVNYILTGSSCKKELFERDSEIEKLELIVIELRNIININLKK